MKTTKGHTVSDSDMVYDYDTYEGMHMAGTAVAKGETDRVVTATIGEYDDDADGVYVYIDGTFESPLVLPSDRHLPIGGDGQTWSGDDGKWRFTLRFTGV